jgi:ubiquinone/menaquinone biosynthesis C-methylase UbiE
MNTLKHPSELATAVAEYWTGHNVSQHRVFADRAESLEYFLWRCDQYVGYIDLMPVRGADGLDVLDYGCGPGHDLVGFLEFSKPKSLAGVDVASSSLAEAKERLALHGGENVRLHRIDPNEARLPFEDRSFDYIHSSGVLHHVPDLQACLREFRRLLKPGGRARVMVYNYDSLWMHLYVAYTLRYRNKTIPPDLPMRQAFSRSTDGPNCPIAHCYTAAEFAAEVGAAGFSCRPVGTAVSLHELDQLQKFHYEACMSPVLEREHRQFLLALTFDERGTPLYQGQPAGIDLVVELRAE